MNTVFFIGGLMGFSNVLKPSVKVDSIPSTTLKQLRTYLFELFYQGQINTHSTLVFDVRTKSDSEVIVFLKNILPEAKNLFQNSWNQFQKSIVILLPQESASKLNNLLNLNGLLSFVHTEDIEDYLDVRGLVE